MDISRDEATFLINHLFLPPKLPNESDEEKGAAKLLDLLAIVAREYGRRLDAAAELEWRPIAQSMATWRDAYKHGELYEDFEDKVTNMLPRCMYKPCC